MMDQAPAASLVTTHSMHFRHRPRTDEKPDTLPEQHHRPQT
jgi:hypothetical protein